MPVCAVVRPGPDASQRFEHRWLSAHNLRFVWPFDCPVAAANQKVMAQCRLGLPTSIPDPNPGLPTQFMLTFRFTDRSTFVLLYTVVLIYSIRNAELAKIALWRMHLSLFSLTIYAGSAGSFFQKKRKCRSPQLRKPCCSSITVVLLPHPVRTTALSSMALQSIIHSYILLLTSQL
jgi:hypothetical protein